jgi:hypothetical protein
MRNQSIQQINFAGWPIPDEYLVEIGRVAALWAWLETFLNICLGKLAGFDEPLDKRAFILITHSTFPQRLDSFGALCEQLQVQFPHLRDYENVVSQLKTAQKMRNRFMHHSMSLNPQNQCVEMEMGSARGTLKMKVEIVSVEDIKRTAININEAQRALYKLVLRRELPPAWECDSARPKKAAS